MGIRSVRLPKNEILNIFRVFAQNNNMYLDESLWPTAAKILGRVNLFPNSRWSFPPGTHFKVDISCAPDAYSTSSTLVEVYVKATASGWLVCCLWIAVLEILLCGSFFWAVSVRSFIPIVMGIIASSPFLIFGDKFGRHLSDRISWSEPRLWQTLPKLERYTVILSMGISHRRRLWGFLGMLGIVELSQGIFMFCYFVSKSNNSTILFISIMLALLGLLLAIFSLGLYLPMFLQLQFFDVFRRTLICLSLSGPLWLFASLFLTVISPSRLDSFLGGPLFVAFVQPLFLVVSVLIAMGIQELTAHCMEDLYSARHPTIVMHAMDKRNRRMLLALCWPLIRIQEIGWIGSFVVMILLGLQLVLGKPVQLQGLAVTFGTDAGLCTLAYLLLPWIIPIGTFLRWANLRTHARLYSFESKGLYGLPTVVEDLKIAAKYIAGTELELRWDISEVTARYERTSCHSWAIVVNPELWAAAMSGDLMPLRFAIYHEAAHIRHIVKLPKWRQILKLICPPAHVSARILHSSGLREEFSADLQAAKHLGDKTTVIGILERFRKGHVTKSYYFSILDIWRDILNTFASDTVYFTPHPQLRALLLRTDKPKVIEDSLDLKEETENGNKEY